MILHKIILENFRQFKGIQEITFEESLPNITIIYGENGRGKTGIFRALIFGLFEERRLSQDDDVNIKDIFLVNTQALEENEGTPVVASVTVILSSEGQTYEIKRKLQGIIKENQIAEQVFEVLLTITDKKGNTKPAITDKIEISEIIGNIFDPKIKDYFLFDGEKIERLTRADSGQKKMVAQGIKNLLNINDLETARKSMDILRSDLNKQIGKNSQGNLPKILKAIEENVKTLENLDRERTQNQENLDKAQALMKNLDSKLDEIKAVKSILDRRKELMENEASIIERQETRIPNLTKKISVVSSALLKKSFQQVYSRLNSKKNAGEIPVQDKLEIIKKILQEQKCICGSCVKQGSPEYNTIISWREKIYDSGLSDEALNIWSDLNAMLQMIPGTIDDVRTNLRELASDEQTLNEIHAQLKLISEEINESSEDAARKYNLLLQECHRDIGTYREKLNQINLQTQSARHDEEDLAKRKVIIIQEEGVQSELIAALNLASDTFAALDNIYRSFTEDMKTQIGEQASKVMHQLLDKEGRFCLKQIVVKDDYSLQVNDHRNEPFLANISAGQRQIISICFITALAKVANGSARFEIPLFMDTPFGRLSFEHRDNLIQYIPTICQQWITMVTDTELTKKEWESYQKASCKCSFYKLCLQKDGTTLIKQIPIDEVPSFI